MKLKQLKWSGHIVTTGKLKCSEGRKTSRGRPRLRWMDGVKKDKFGAGGKQQGTRRGGRGL
jgi:hypothetical protein